MSHHRGRSSSSSSSSSISYWSISCWRIWTFFWWNVKAILSLPLFVKVRVNQTINYFTSSSSTTESTSSRLSRNNHHHHQTVLEEEEEEGKKEEKRIKERGGEKKYKTGKMAHVLLSKTMTLLGIAFVIHFIILSTFADKGSLGDFSSLSMSSSLSSSASSFARHGGFGTRRQPRSYRSEKDPSKSLASSNIVAPVAGGAAVAAAGAAAPRPPDKTEALFVTENSTVVTAQIGSTANLPCIVKNLGNGVASWIRRHDYHLLTVGMGSYSNDNRFFVSHNRPNQNWELHIKFVKPSDEGIYECQISNHPPASIFLRLVIVEAKAEILGEPDKHVRSGSTFELVCVLRDSTEPPVYVFWYHNDRMINYDNERGVVVSSDVEKSILTIQEAQKSDSGNYTCQPSNASPSSIVVHILNGEKPAAMQHGSRSGGIKTQGSPPTSLIFVISFLSFILTTWLGYSSGSSSSSSSSKTYQSQQNQQSPPQPPPPPSRPSYHHHHHHRHQDKLRKKRKKEEESLSLQVNTRSSSNTAKPERSPENRQSQGGGEETETKQEVREIIIDRGATLRSSPQPSSPKSTNELSSDKSQTSSCCRPSRHISNNNNNYNNRNKYSHSSFGPGGDRLRPSSPAPRLLPPPPSSSLSPPSSSCLRGGEDDQSPPTATTLISSSYSSSSASWETKVTFLLGYCAASPHDDDYILDLNSSCFPLLSSSHLFLLLLLLRPRKSKPRMTVESEPSQLIPITISHLSSASTLSSSSSS